MHTLEVDSVRVVFNNRTLLSDVYLKCETGIIIGLLGRNGSGKSSLLRIIFGTLSAEYQSVRLNGKYVRKLYREPQAVHFLPQTGLALPYLTGRQLLRLFVTQAESYEAVMQVPEIERYQHLRFDTLSTGLQKFWEVILLLYADTRFLLLDEPFSGLSPKLVEQLIPHFQQQVQYKGIIITDHWYKTVLSLSHSVVLLVNGKTRQLREQEELYEWGYLLPPKYHG